MKNWDYIKKYKLPEYGAPILMCMTISALLLPNWENSIVHIIGIGICGIILIACLFELLTIKYQEKVFTLMEIEKIDDITYSCIFFEPETQKAVRYVHYDKDGKPLEVNKNYVILTTNKYYSKFVELLGPAEDQTLMFEAARQSALSNLKVEEQQALTEDTQKDGLIENVNSTINITINIIQCLVALAIGLPFIYMAVMVRVEPKNSIPLVLFFGIALLIFSIKKIVGVVAIIKRK